MTRVTHLFSSDLPAGCALWFLQGLRHCLCSVSTDLRADQNDIDAQNPYMPRCLRSLQVIIEDELLSDRGATLLWTVQRLPALTDLALRLDAGFGVIHLDPVSDTHALPRCQELAELRSSSLTWLCVTMIGEPAVGGQAEDNTLQLVGLPELRSFQLYGVKAMPPAVNIDATSFGGTPRLQALRLESVEPLQLREGSLQELTTLTALTLCGCGLRSVPADLATALGPTLCVLDLSYNDQLQIDSTALACIVQCSRLKTLGLFKPSINVWEGRLSNDVWQGVAQHIGQEGYVPAQFSCESLAQLVRLPSVFRKRHGRDLSLLIDWKDYVEVSYASGGVVNACL